jgi:hypothetical protein
MRAPFLAASRNSLIYCDAGSRQPSGELRNPMPIVMDQILHGTADQAFEGARLGRNGVHAKCEQVFARFLAELEARGDAMRFVDTNGRIAWKATPSLCQHLVDLEVDAQGDLEDV